MVPRISTGGFREYEGRLGSLSLGMILSPPRSGVKRSQSGGPITRKRLHCCCSFFFISLPYAGGGRLNNAGTEARVVLQAVPRVRNIWPLNHQAREDAWWLQRLTTARGNRPANISISVVYTRALSLKESHNRSRYCGVSRRVASRRSKPRYRS